MKNLAYALTTALLLLVPVLTVSPSLTEGADQDGLSPGAFPHQSHLDQGMVCAGCHVKAHASSKAAESNRPPIDVCRDCHDEDSEEIKSVSWGAEPEARSIRPQISSELIFSHKAHADRGFECEHCHLEQEATQSVVQTPGMGSCFRCHEGRRGLDDCAACHSGVAILRPIDHDIGWTNHHREDARMGDGRCAACHNADYCQECHEGGRSLPTETPPVEQFLPYGPQVAADQLLVQRAHELNYRFTHSLDAAGKETECQTCHLTDSFCSDCHTSGDPSQLRPLWHGGTDWGAIPGGVGSGGGRHAEMARRDMELCAACHEITLAGTDPTCLTCHRDFSPSRGNDPSTHDPGFASGAGKGEWHDDDGAVCYVCHTRSQNSGDAGFCGYCHGPMDEN